MSNKQPAKVRLVKCPRCTKILPEPTEVPLYRCGGCGTTLQAKYYKGDSKIKASSNEPSSVLNHGALNLHSASSSQNSCSAGEYTEQNKDTDEHVVKDGNMKELETTNCGDKASSVNERPPLVTQGSLELLPDNYSEEMEYLEKNFCLLDVEDHNAFTQTSTAEASEEKLKLVLVNGQVGGTDQSVGNISMSSEPVNLNSIVQYVLRSQEREEGTDQNFTDTGELLKLAPEKSCSLASLASDPGQLRIRESLPAAVEGGEMGSQKMKQISQPQNAQERDNKEADDVASRSEGLESVTKLLSGIDLSSIKVQQTATADEHKASSLLPVTDVVDEKNDVRSDSDRKIENSVESDVNVHVSDFASAMQLTPRVEEQSGGKLLLPEANEEPGRINSSFYQENGDIHYSVIRSESKFKRWSSDIIRASSSDFKQLAETTSPGFKYANAISSVPSMELPVCSRDGVTLKKLHKIPNKSVFACDGSISLFDESDDNVLQRNSESDMEAFMATSEIEDRLLDKYARHLSNGNGGSLQILQERQNYRESWRNKRYQQHPVRSSMPTAHEFLQGTEQGMRRRIGEIREEQFLSGFPLYSKSDGDDYELNSCSRYKHEDDRHTVDRRYIMSHEIGARRIFTEASGGIQNDPMKYSYYEGRTETRPHGYAPMPFSRQNVNSYFHASGSHLPHHRGESSWSSQLASPPNRYDRMSDPTTSSLESQQHSMAYDSEAAWSAGPRHSDYMMRRLHSIKKHQLMKRHIRPVAGGAPFLTCYECSELLQLPADFLRSKRTHHLKCSSCSKALKFTLQNHHHLVPYVQKASPYPNKAIANEGSKSIRSLSASQAEYEISVHQPLAHGRHSSARDAQTASIERREMPWHRSSEALDKERLKLESENSPIRDMVFGEQHDSAGPSSYDSKQMEGPRQLTFRSRSPLHRLMGYVSPSEVLQGLSHFRN